MLPYNIQQQTVESEYETVYRAVLREVEVNVLPKITQLSMLRTMNDINVPFGVDMTTVISGTTMTYGQLSDAITLLNSFQLWASTPIADGKPSPLYIIYKRT